jgi:hypothetical protein
LTLERFCIPLRGLRSTRLVAILVLSGPALACGGEAGTVEKGSADAVAPLDSTVAPSDDASSDDSGKKAMPDAGAPEQDGDPQPIEAATTDAGTDAWDAGAEMDSGTDALPPTPLDAGCSGVLCNGKCSAAPDCRGCSGAPLLCRVTGACVADCAGCSAQPVECFVCDGKQQNPLGTCEPDNPADYCLNGNYSHAYDGDAAATRCGCTTSTDCPGDDQICIRNPNNQLLVCYTCGEAKKLTQGATCKNGHTCVAASASCQ